MHTSTWYNYRHRRNVFWILLLSYLPGVAVTAFVLRTATGSDAGVMFVAGAWLVAYGIAGWRFGHFPCPRCSRSFFIRRFMFCVWTRQCLHCGLAKWADPKTQVTDTPSAQDSG